MIEGVILTPLNQIFDERGKVMHMLSTRSSVFSKFGEIYFSCTYPGVVKAWHLHTEMTLNYAVVAGEIKFVLYDDREIICWSQFRLWSGTVSRVSVQTPRSLLIAPISLMMIEKYKDVRLMIQQSHIVGHLNIDNDSYV